jgi:HEAT repeat protein
VQREAIRAIVNIGSEPAFQVLREALTNGTDRSRDAIMQSLSLIRDERVAALFAYMLRHIDHRGRLAAVYARSIEALGGAKAPEAVAALKDALHRGEWWAPKRTAALRGAAAAALAKIGTPEAVEALESVADSGPRGARSAARAHLAAGRAALKRRETAR